MESILKSFPAALAVAFAAAAHAAPPVPLADSFPPDAVSIDGGPLKQAEAKDREYLLKLNPDSMVWSLRKHAGLPSNAPHYGGWEAGGNGMIGHYLSALCRMAVVTGDAELRRRAEYVVDQLEQVQKAKHNGALYSFGSDVNYFAKLSKNEQGYPPVNGWYVTSKTMAGVRDAYLLLRTEQAKRVFLRLCDWAVDVTKNLPDESFQKVLDGEHGGPHEVLADAYAVTGDSKYLDLALRFTHRKQFDRLAKNDTRVLDGLHANTVLQKIVGYERVYEVTGDKAFDAAVANFYTDVVKHRTWANGGNSQWEGFFDPAKTEEKMAEVCGPETCNTYNMLKLTAMRFRLKPDAALIDYYENATFNHILPSQNLDHGGFVYYTSMRPGHYRTTSTDFGGFWCCVGTGIENHARYNELIYAKAADDSAVYVNLFVPSTLKWSSRGVTIRQATEFPNAGSSTLTVQAASPQRFVMRVRCPAWVAAGEFKVSVNGQPMKTAAKPGSYVEIDRTWASGDTVALTMPMRLSGELLQTSDDYVAIKYGPILLAAEMGRGPLTPEDFRPTQQKGNMLARRRLPATDAPVLIAPNARDVPARVRPVDGKPLTFTTAGLTRPGPATLVPMWQLGDQRYVVYFRMTSEADYAATTRKVKQDEQAALALDARTIDRVRVGEQQPEADHGLKSDRSNTGRAPEPYDNWRDAKGFFSYEMNIAADRGPLAVRCVYLGNDAGRTFDILVDGQAIGTQTLKGERPGQYFDVEYAIPPTLLSGKKAVTVRFQPQAGSNAGGVFDVRIVAAR